MDKQSIHIGEFEQAFERELTELTRLIEHAQLRPMFPESRISDAAFLTRLRAGIEEAEAPFTARTTLMSKSLFVQLAGVCAVVFLLIAKFGNVPMPDVAATTDATYSAAGSISGIADYGPTASDLADLEAANVSVDSIAAALGVGSLLDEVDLSDSDEPTTDDLLKLDDSQIAVVMSELESTEFF
jgi:hypothetical protein